MPKRPIIGLSCLLLILGACSDSDRHITSPNHTIYGSGNLISETLYLSNFSSITLNTVATVNLTYGESQEVIITVDDNIREYVKFTVYNRHFYLDTRKDVNLDEFTIIMDITIPQIETIVINGVGNVIGQNEFAGDYLYLVMNGVGYIQLDLDFYEVRSDMNAVGNVNLGGSAVNQIANISSVGNLDAFELETDTSYVSCNSVGNAHVRVNRYLRATIGSLGSIYYRGYPVIHQTIEGQGRVVDAN
ncbi:MAG: DUF2807 domain-containing protein [Candidatus Zixiibacteriota bacterium]|nr:MAG: DUF2807 domain-containing protein [candidate division Zixibacteria bacterium]